MNKIVKEFMHTQNINYIYKNDLDKACVQHDMTYSKYKDFVKRTEPDKFLRDKVLKIASNPKYDGYERGLASVAYELFEKKYTGSGIKSTLNQQLADELHKAIIRNLKDAKSILLLKTIFGELILLICN